MGYCAVAQWVRAVVGYSSTFGAGMRRIMMGKSPDLRDPVNGFLVAE
jgi:hypothetical protein